MTRLISPVGTFHVLALALSAALFLVACRESSPSAQAAASASVAAPTQERITIALPPHGKLPGVGLDLSITPASGADQEVSALASLVHQAMKTCSDHIKANQVVRGRFSLTIAEKRVKATDESPKSPLTTCLGREMTRSNWTGSDLERQVSMEIRLPGGVQ